MIIQVKLPTDAKYIFLFKQVNNIFLRSKECKWIPLSITNKMQHHTIFFIAVEALHVSSGFSAHHQELKLYTQHLV